MWDCCCICFHPGVKCLMSCKHHNLCVCAPTGPLHGFRGTGARTNTAQNYTDALNQVQPDNLIAVLHIQSDIFTFSVLMLYLCPIGPTELQMFKHVPEKRRTGICFGFYLISSLLLPIEAHRQTWRDIELIEFVLPLIGGVWGMKSAVFLKKPWTVFLMGWYFGCECEPNNL